MMNNPENNMPGEGENPSQTTFWPDQALKGC